MACLYIKLDYEEYKAIEHQLNPKSETTHKSVDGFYHKSIRLKLSDGPVMLEFHGPDVMARED